MKMSVISVDDKVTYIANNLCNLLHKFTIVV